MSSLESNALVKFKKIPFMSRSVSSSIKTPPNPLDLCWLTIVVPSISPSQFVKFIISLFTFQFPKIILIYLFIFSKSLYYNRLNSEILYWKTYWRDLGRIQTLVYDTSSNRPNIRHLYDLYIFLVRLICY